MSVEQLPPPSPDELYASRFPTIREPGDDAAFGCCPIPWVSPHHAPDCLDRCPYCRSEGGDNDHREGCPTIGTCAQCEPRLPRPWHPEPACGEEFIERLREHYRIEHPDWRFRW